MTPQEKDLITTLLARLKSAAGQPKDAEAEALIGEAMRDQPDAPYFLVQTVLIQDLSLHNAQNRVAELEKQLTEAQRQAARPTSFLGGLFGHNEPAATPGVPPTSAQPAGPWTRAQPAAPTVPPYAQPAYGQPSYPPPGYGGSPTGGFLGSGHSFLRSAAATAAGVAGGALLFEGIESMLGRHESAGIMGGQMIPGVGETMVNNYYGSDAGGTGDLGPSDVGGGGYDQSYDPSGQDFGSDQDFGGQDVASDQDFGGDFDTGSDDWNC